jgi:hypothetical protein
VASTADETEDPASSMSVSQAAKTSIDTSNNSNKSTIAQRRASIVASNDDETLVVVAQPLDNGATAGDNNNNNNNDDDDETIDVEAPLAALHAIAELRDAALHDGKQ